MSTVSIVLSTYNGARYLRESIASCLGQSYPDIELIVVDDCSTDETHSILEEIKDPRVRHVRNAVNQGLPRSLNIGFAHSTGDYLTWTSDDNLYAPAAIEQMLSYLEGHPDVAMVYADYWGIDAKGEVYARVILRPPSYLEEFNCVNACFLYRRIVYETIGNYDPSVTLCEDYDYWLRVYQRFKMAWLPEPLYYYRRHPESLTSQHGIVKQQCLAEQVRMRWVGRAPYRFPSRLARNFGRIYMDYAFEADRERSWRARRANLLRALFHDPRYLANVGVCKLLASSVVRLATGNEGQR